MAKKKVLFIAEAMVDGTGYAKGDTLEVEGKQADKLIRLRLALDHKSDAAKAIIEAEGEEEVSKKEFSTLKGKLTVSEKKVKELEAKVAELETAAEAKK